jgi:hypothetical protein
MDLFCSHPWPKWPAPMMFYTKSDLFAPGISGRGDLAPTVCWAGNRGYSIRIWYYTDFAVIVLQQQKRPPCGAALSL